MRGHRRGPAGGPGPDASAPFGEDASRGPSGEVSPGSAGRPGARATRLVHRHCSRPDLARDAAQRLGLRVVAESPDAGGVRLELVAATSVEPGSYYAEYRRLLGIG